MKLLTLGNPKTQKSVKLGYLTAVLHLAPANRSGFEMCPKRTKGCTRACLNEAGRGGIFAAGATTNPIQECRIRRARLLIEDPSRFLRDLSADLGAVCRAADRLGLRPAFRPNGTSDLNWSDLSTDLGREWNGRGMTAGRIGDAFRGLLCGFEHRHGVALYDYTKRLSLVAEYRRNGFPCHLTFSRAETAANKADAREAFRLGLNVAAVFGTKRNGDLPAEYDGREVLDGDKSDLRFLDAPGCWVGLRAKGPAIRDRSGFVLW